MQSNHRIATIACEKGNSIVKTAPDSTHEERYLSTRPAHAAAKCFSKPVGIPEKDYLRCESEDASPNRCIVIIRMKLWRDPRLPNQCKRDLSVSHITISIVLAHSLLSFLTSPLHSFAFYFIFERFDRESLCCWSVVYKPP